jgi:hypothetical protein
MADKIEYSRMLVKRTAQTGEVPTVPPITAVTLNQFIPTDIFVGEFFLNEADDLLWIRTDNGILPISLSGSTGTTTTPNLTQVLFEGNATNGYNIEVSAGDTVVFSGLSSGVTSQFLGIDASGNTIVSTVTPGTPDLEDVLTVGNTTGANDISVNIGYKVEGQSGGNWVRPETSDGHLELNTDNELTIVGISSGVTNVFLSYDPDTKFVRYQAGGTGSSGSNGTSGSSGVNGSSGSTGASGSSGSSGSSGVDGSRGESGSSGTSGTSGLSGVNGTAGTSGSDGSAGATGASGTNGTSGTSSTGTTSSVFTSGSGLNSVISTYLTSTNAPGPYSLNIQGTGNTITNTQRFTGCVGGSGNSISGTQEKVYIINSENSTISGPSRYSAIINGYASSITSGDGNTAIGRNNVIAGSNDNALIGGHQNTITSSGEGLIGGGYAQSMSNANDSGIYAGRGNSINGGGCCGGNIILAGESNSINNSPGRYNGILQGNTNNIRSSANYSTIINGITNTISSSQPYNNIIGSQSSTVTGTTSGATMIGTVNRSADRNNCVFVENLKLFNYPSLDFANDSDAAAGGVVLGQVYHTSGTLKIRIT